MRACVYMLCEYHVVLLNSTDIEMLKKTEVATLKKDSEETKEQLKKLKGMFQVRGHWVSCQHQFMAYAQTGRDAENQIWNQFRLQFGKI